MHPGRKAIAQGAKFFRKQKDRMHYAEYRARGLPGIGSGVEESTVKALITQRLKGPGMRWGERGFGQAVLSVRPLRKSGRYDAARKELMRIMEPEPLRIRARPERHNILNMTVNGLIAPQEFGPFAIAFSSAVRAPSFFLVTITLSAPSRPSSVRAQKIRTPQEVGGW